MLLHPIVLQLHFVSARSGSTFYKHSLKFRPRIDQLLTAQLAQRYGLQIAKALRTDWKQHVARLEPCTNRPAKCSVTPSSFEWSSGRICALIRLRGQATDTCAERRWSVMCKRQKPAPEEASDVVGRHAQMFGRAAADLIPIIATGIAVRYGFGKAFSETMQVDNLLTQALHGRSERCRIGNDRHADRRFASSNRIGQSSEHVIIFARSCTERHQLGVVIRGFNRYQRRHVLHRRTSSREHGSSPAGESVCKRLNFRSARWFCQRTNRLAASQHKFTTDGAAIGRSVYEMTLLGGVIGGLTASFPAARAHTGGEASVAGFRKRERFLA